MSYQDDLDWLARNVHAWLGRVAEKVFIDGNQKPVWLMYPESISQEFFTKDQWLARRAELQNKPSFNDHPDAKCFVQHKSGLWLKNTSTNEIQCTHGDMWKAVSSTPGSWKKISHGEVLGDWRDTLERRPDMHKTTPEIDTPAERVQKRPESIRNWREAGELPPVGVFVDVTGDVAYGEGEKGCEVIAHVENCAVIRMSWGLGCFVSRALSPHRTEKDDAVEAMKALCPYPGSWETTYRLFAEALYDAGYRAGGFE